MERPNQGKSFVPSVQNPLPDTSFAWPPTQSHPMVTFAVTTPRHLAPTVGPAAKSVIIKGAALEGMKNLVVGRIIINMEGEPIVDDSGWGPESDLLESGEVIPIGKINVFVGLIHATRSASDEEYESVSGAATLVQSDGEESVGTPEHTDLVVITPKSKRSL